MRYNPFLTPSNSILITGVEISLSDETSLAVSEAIRLGCILDHHFSKLKST